MDFAAAAAKRCPGDTMVLVRTGDRQLETTPYFATLTR